MCDPKKKEYVHIKCNSIVKKFSMARVRQLGIDVGLARLYMNLKRDGSTSCIRDTRATKLAEKLIKLIPGIRPRIMMTTADVNEVTLFISKWKERVSDMLQERQYTPVYYSDVVNSLLIGKSDIKCTSVHLGWCLSILGPKNMKPGKIVDEILKHQSKEWNKLLPLAYDDYYSVRMTPISEDIQADFREKIEFIYRLSIPTTKDSLINELENDIKVVTDIKHLHESSPADYRELIKEYLKLINKLQTISPSILPKKLIKKLEGITQKDNTQEKSSAATRQTMKNNSGVSNDTITEKSNNLSEANRIPIIQNIPQKDNDKTSSLFTSNDNEDTPINDDVILEKEDSSDYPDEVPGEPGDDELNYRDLMEYLNEKVKYDSSGKEKLMNAKDIIYAFCKLEEFSKRFEQLRAMIDSGTVKWPGGFAVGEMKKMLNPEYVPNIR